MKTHTYTVLWQSCRERLKRHGHTLASFFCAMLMGVLFASHIGTYFARVPAETLTSGSAYMRLPLPPKEIFTMNEVAVSEPAPVRIVSAYERLPLPKKNAEVTHEAAPASTMSSVSNIETSVSSSVAAAPDETTFPPMGRAGYPVSKVPNWGAMHTPDVWNRTYAEMTPEDFVSVPRYDMAVLQTPMAGLIKPLRSENIPLITAKLFYSTRYFAAYDTDAGEWSGLHAGIDLKLARGTPVGAIAGGRVSSVTQNDMFGLHVIIEHRAKNGDTFYSIYGHLDTAALKEGDDVVSGQTVGRVGMTGHTTAPHLHLQVDRGVAGENHTPYVPGVPLNRADAEKHVMNPISFISRYRSGE